MQLYGYYLFFDMRTSWIVLEETVATGEWPKHMSDDHLINSAIFWDSAVFWSGGWQCVAGQTKSYTFERDF